MELILVAVACCAALSGLYALAVALSFRARVEQLEVERPKFLAEMNGLLDACEEAVDRADAKRKRAENAARGRGAELTPAPRRRGTVLEPLQ